MLTWKIIIDQGLNVREAEKLVAKQNRRARKAKSSPQKDESLILKDISESLAKHLKTKVNIKGSPRKGRLEVFYYSEEDLERIVEMISK